MSLPLRFLVVYECVECGEEYEMENCKVPYFFTPCDGCGDGIERRQFKPQKIIHKSFEWDRVED